MSVTAIPQPPSGARALRARLRRRRVQNQWLACAASRPASALAALTCTFFLREDPTTTTSHHEHCAYDCASGGPERNRPPDRPVEREVPTHNPFFATGAPAAHPDRRVWL